MNEITRSERIASERLSSLESPTRRLLMKGMAGLGATLVSSSLSAAIAAQTHQPGAPSNQVPPDQVGWGPFTPSSGEGRYLQVAYPPSTTKGELQISVIPKLSDFFDCCSVFGQRAENQSGFGVTAGQKWFECGQRSERATLGGTCCRSRPRSAEVVRHLSFSTSVLIPVDDQSACERLAW